MIHAEYLMNKLGVYADQLSPACENVGKLKCRHQVQELRTFLNGPYGEREHHIAALFGCRMTGKTTIMLQTIAAMPAEEQQKTLFIDGHAGLSMDELVSYLIMASQKGVRNVFIDEATWINGFGPGCSQLNSAIFSGMKFVLSGTNSLLLWLIYNNEYCECGPFIATAPISYGEWSEILGDNYTIDAYLCNGGTMNRTGFNSSEKLNRYVFSSFARNIEESIKNYPDGSEFFALAKMNKTGLLPLSINYIIKDISHNIFKNDIENALINFDSGDRKAISLYFQEKFAEKSYQELTDLNTRLLRAFRARVGAHAFSEDNPPQLGEYEAEILIKALIDIDFLRPWPIRHFSLTSQAEIPADGTQYIMTMPCVRYRQTLTLTEEARKLLKTTDLPNTMELQKLLSADSFGSLGTLLEESLFLDLQQAAADTWQVFKAIFFENTRKVGEIDIITVNTEGEALLFEVKHTKKPTKSMTNRLTNEKILNVLRSNNINPIGKFLIADIENNDILNNCDIISAQQFMKDLWKNGSTVLSNLQNRKTTGSLLAS